MGAWWQDGALQVWYIFTQEDGFSKGVSLQADTARRR